jgi:hypothetical protein
MQVCCEDEGARCGGDDARDVGAERENRGWLSRESSHVAMVAVRRLWFCEDSVKVVLGN